MKKTFSVEVLDTEDNIDGVSTIEIYSKALDLYSVIKDYDQLLRNLLKYQEDNYDLAVMELVQELRDHLREFCDDHGVKL